MHEPLRFTAPLAAFNARVARMQAQRGYSIGLLDEWRHQYGIEATCGISELTAPEDIAEAIDQIAALQSTPHPCSGARCRAKATATGPRLPRFQPACGETPLPPLCAAASDAWFDVSSSI